MNWSTELSDSFILAVSYQLGPRAFQFAIRIESIRYANRFVLQKNRPFDSLVVMQFFLLIYCSLSQKISCYYCLRRLILQNMDKNSYALHTLKITPNLLFE